MVQHEGFWFPDHESISWKQMIEDLADLDRAISYVNDTRVCVQAGGNVGVWAIRLARLFKDVITIEPDWENYDCLLRNIKESNVGGIHTIFGALGDSHGWANLSRQIGNSGGHSIIPSLSGVINIFTIDSLQLEACDMMVLDLEGMEPLALKGAMETINKFHPVIMVEDKWNSERYGITRGWSYGFPGYRVAEYVGRHRDTILVPDSGASREIGSVVKEVSQGLSRQSDHQVHAV